VVTGEPVLGIDLAARVARTARREIRFERLVSSAPFNRLLTLSAVPHDPTVFTWNKVLVFNLGFDRKGPKEPHWIYYPARDRAFYRVGFYDNIFDAERLSIYVEVGYARGAVVDVPAMKARVLADLAKEGVTDGHRLVAEHHVVMDPAYVHITQASLSAQREHSAYLARHGVHSIGRYGGWTYCSIEDNIVEARALVKTFG
jgi:hypothetical protein